MAYLIDSLLDCTTEIDKKWVIARPVSASGWYGLKNRMKDAWRVLSGKSDAINFYKQ